MHRIRAILVVAVLTGCADYAAPVTSPSYTLAYPQGVVADFPNQAPGAVLEVSAQVLTSRGKPAVGVVVNWVDGYVSPAVQPQYATTDSAEIARARWATRAPHPGQFDRPQVLRGYLPGADHSPLEFRVTVYPCSKGC